MANFFIPAGKSQEKNQQLIVTIDKLDMNGVGVARWKNKPVFIAGALPKEVVKVKVLEQKSKYIRAKLLSVQQRSDIRVEPQCQHFGLCGGCDLQMIDVNSQLSFKQEKVTELFSRCFSALNLTNKKEKTVLPWQANLIDNPWHYRRKARIGVQFDKKAHATIGFRKKATNQLTAIKSCPILVTPLNEVFHLLRRLLAQLSIKSAIGHIELIQADVIDKKQQEQHSINNQTIVVVRQLKPMNDADSQLWQLSAEKYNWFVLIDDGLSQTTLNENMFSNSALLSYRLADNTRVTFSSSDFIQINHNINIDMINQALSWLNLSVEDSVLDLFCGLGNFSLALAKQSKFVVGVEGVQMMVDKANYNAKINNIKNCSFYQADLNSDWLSECWLKENHFDKVLLDPARAGAEKAVKQIATLKIPYVLYVSCDPATLARDSAILVSKGYKLDKISLMDMFSQTKHVETMVLFTL
ncbi:23S rRNA (uracil(1939)-C(5))-methyltransferase RlmD [Colwelliaceae bacterium MEBiC 14330]